MRKFLPHIARLTLIAFILSAILPFIATYDANTAHVSALLGDKILICTGDGFKWVALSDLKNEPPKPHAPIKCPACYLAAHAIKAVPVVSTPFIFASFLLQAGTLPARDDHLAASPVASFKHPRAPPLSLLS